MPLRLSFLSIVFAALLAGCTHPPQTQPQPYTDDCPCRPSGSNSNYPNPFSPPPFGCIYHVVADSAMVCLVVMNVPGQPMDTLVNSFQPPGEYCWKWPKNGEQFLSGIYFFRLAVGDSTFAKRIVYLR
jgi:hypothetical protein